MIPASWTSLDRYWSSRLLLDERAAILQRAAAVVARSGDSWVCILALVLVYWLLPEWRTEAASVLIAVGAIAIIVLLVKLVVKRKRPEGSWGTIYRKIDPHSFPSGHAARTFMLALLIPALGPIWLAPPLIVWALAVAAARVGKGVHFLSDVAAGALLGLATGLAAIMLQGLF